MEFYVLKENQQTGPYDDAQIRQALANGTISYDDLAWREGLAEWQPLSVLFPRQTPPPQMPPPKPPSPLPQAVNLKPDAKLSKSLKSCPACGSQIAKSAKTCPQCGKKLKMGCLPKLALIIIAVIVVAIAAGVQNQEGTGKNSKPSSSSTANKTEPESGKSTNQSSSTTSSPSDAKTDAATDSSIKIKGLYIGMDLAKAHDILRDALAGTRWLVSKAQKSSSTGADAIIITIAPVPDGQIDGALVMFGTNGIEGVIFADSDGRVNSIIFMNDLVNDMFKATDMEAGEFAQQFATSYHIPDLKVSENMDSWIYTSPDGVKITIDDKKDLKLQKAANEKERQSSFN